MNTYPEQLARVQADISNPSQASVTVSAIARIVVIDMARKIFVRFAEEKKDSPIIAVKKMMLIIIAMTADQSKRNAPTLFHCILSMVSSNHIVHNFLFFRFSRLSLSGNLTVI